MNKKSKFALFLNVTIIVLLVCYVSQNLSDFQQLTVAHSGFLALVFLVQMTSLVVTGLFITASIKVFGVHVKPKDGFTASVLSTLGNFFMPAGTGASLRALYLKRKYGLNFTKFMSTLYGNYVLVFLINSLIGLIAMIGLYEKAELSQYKLTVIILSVTLIVSILFISKKINRYIISCINKLPVPVRIKEHTVRMVDGWRIMVASKEIWQISLLILISAALQVLLIYFLALSIFVEPSVVGVILLSTLSSIILVLNITPGSIGIREGVFAFSAFAMNITISEAILISLLERITRFIIMVVAWLLIKRFGQSLLSTLK